MKTMRILASIYTALAIAVSAWEFYTFGRGSIFVVLMLALFVAISWQAALRSVPLKTMDYIRAALLGLLTAGVVVFVTVQYYKHGVDRRAAFQREYYAFRRAVARRPEYANLEVDYTQRKGGRVYLKGSVATEDAHTRLLELFDKTFKNCESGYFDGVTISASPSEASNL